MRAELLVQIPVFVLKLSMKKLAFLPYILRSHTSGLRGVASLNLINN